MKRALGSQLLLAGFVFSWSAAVVPAADWPLWRGPTGDNKAAADAAPPTNWSESSNIRWQTSLPGEGHASPIVVGNQVIVSLCNRSRQIFGLVSVNRESGKVEWSEVAHRGGVPSKNPSQEHSCLTDPRL